MSLGTFVAVAVIVAVVGLVVIGYRELSRKSRPGRRARGTDKGEAMFRASFPDLHPHFHPSRVAKHVTARRQRPAGAGTWDRPSGFPAAARARIEVTPKGERTVVEDSSGARLAEFLYLPGDRPDTLGIVRVGEGKFRVRPTGHVSYWHPDREFKWRGPGQWTFASRVAERSIDADGDETGWSDDDTDSDADTDPDTSPSHAHGALIGTAAAGAAVAVAAASDGRERGEHGSEAPSGATSDPLAETAVEAAGEVGAGADLASETSY